MRQVLQNLADGRVDVAEIPAPSLRPGHILVQTTKSVISPGTERMLRDFGRSSIFGKAFQQPERVRDVLQKIRTDGLATTAEAVQAKLSQPVPLGYCNVGRVIGVASDVIGFSIGDRVASNGSHAEVVSVPVNLAARIPEHVSDDQAAFTVLSSIALQGLRLLAPTLGECVVVTGLGLIGLIAVQLLHAQGNRVLGIDVDPSRCEMARRFGADTVCLQLGEDVAARANEFSRGRGVDGVLICASTKSSGPIEQAAQITRPKGRVVLVGVVGLEIPRDPFYRKELTFQVSCSYGPGRYDPAYEERGQDYPVGHVRWTEQRNFEAVLDCLAAGTLDCDPFISCRYKLEDAVTAYSNLDNGPSILGIVLEYPQQDVPLSSPLPSFQIAKPKSVSPTQNVRVGVIGAGNYASRQLVPALRDAGAQLTTICSSTGLSAAFVANKFKFKRTDSNIENVLYAADIDLVVIATRHNSHATLVSQAIKAGKAVFVEKPLAVAEEEVAMIAQSAASATRPFVMVGFNRRFAPYVIPIQKAISQSKAPASILITVNAGAIPADHWTQNSTVGGGRIIGEGCHFIDLARHLAGDPIQEMQCMALGRTAGDKNPEDKAIISLRFENGSVASIQYLANGNKNYPKERIEVFCDGKIWQIDNFRRLKGFGTKGVAGSLLGAQDKGQTAMAKSVVDALRNGDPAPIPLEQLLEVAQKSILADRLLRGI